MKSFKNFLSIILVVMMVLSCTFVTSFAAGIGSSKDRYSVLVLDVSGSMSGRPVEELKKGAVAFCEQVFTSTRNNNKVAVVSFASNSKVVCDFTSDLSTLKTAIDGLYASGGTNLSGGLSSAKSLLEAVNGDVIKNMVVMCDGVPNSDSDAYNVIKSIPLHWNVYGLYYSQDGFSKSAETVMKNVGRNGYVNVDGVNTVLEFSFIDNGTTITTKSVNHVVIRIACPVNVSVTLNGVTLNKDNPQTTFGKIEFEGSGNDEVKILTLAYRNDYVINIDGYDNGTMDVDVSYRCNEDELYSLSYPTTNITSNTKITTGIDIDNTNITLDVDEDNDGVIDEKISPNTSISSFWYKVKVFFSELFYAIRDFFVRIFSFSK